MVCSLCYSAHMTTQTSNRLSFRERVIFLAVVSALCGLLAGVIIHFAYPGGAVIDVTPGSGHVAVQVPLVDQGE